MNALVAERFCLREISINVNKLFIVYLVYVRPRRIVVVAIFPLFLYCTLLLLVYFFIPFYVVKLHFVAASLFLYPLIFFYTNVVAIFLFIS